MKCGFRFFSLKPECVDLLSFKHTYGSRVILIGGIHAAWLAREELDQKQQKEWLQELRALVGQGGLILASGCGLYSPKFLPILRQLYRLAESVPFLSPDHSDNET